MMESAPTCRVDVVVQVLPPPPTLLLPTPLANLYINSVWSCNGPGHHTPLDVASGVLVVNIHTYKYKHGDGHRYSLIQMRISL